MEFQRRKGKEPQTVESEEGDLMSIELLPKQPGHIVRPGTQLSAEMRESMTEILVGGSY